MPQCFFCSCTKSTPAYYPIISFNKKNFEYRLCSDCNLTYITPSLDAQDLKVLYSLNYHEEFYFNSDRSYPQQLALLKQMKPSGRLLDYGCGDASFLRYFKGHGYELHGAEYNPDLVFKLQTAFPEIQFTTIASILEDDSQFYDVIHLGDVLEHLLNPKEIIENLKKRLTPGGVLFVEGPVEHNFHLAYLFRSAYFFLRKTFQPKRVAPMLPYHVLFATADNQLSFFKRIGFSTLHYSIFEWPWPFPHYWKDAKSIKQKFEFLIGQLSVASSKVIKQWGNRFYYIGSK